MHVKQLPCPAERVMLSLNVLLANFVGEWSAVCNCKSYQLIRQAFGNEASTGNHFASADQHE
jgi:hypothetical protein